MPTGYTAKLMKDGQDFPDFVMGCARAFGALVNMRDEPQDADIPDKFEPSNYYSEKIIEEKEELTILLGMNDDEKISFGTKKRIEAIATNKEWLAREKAQNNRLKEMEEKVISWEPPSKDHQGLKDFMLDQINISKNRLGYIIGEIKKAYDQPVLSYYENAVSSAEKSIAYNQEQSEKENKRACDRTKWVQQLRASL